MSPSIGMTLLYVLVCSLGTATGTVLGLQASGLRIPLWPPFFKALGLALPIFALMGVGLYSMGVF